LLEELYLCTIWGYLNIRGSLSNDLVARSSEKHRDKPLVKGTHEMEMGYKLLDYERTEKGDGAAYSMLGFAAAQLTWT
jgi:hypothetical protein